MTKEIDGEAEQIAYSQIEDVVNYCKNKKILGLDTETSGLFNHSNVMIMLQIGDEDTQFVIDVRTIDISPLKEVLENPNIIKVLQNAAFDYKFFRMYKIMLVNVWDTQLAEMILTAGPDNNEVNLGFITNKYLNIFLDKSVRNQFIGMKGQPFTCKQVVYGAKDVEYLLGIRKEQLKDIEKYDLEPCLRLENKFMSVLADIEYNGFYLDREMWSKLEISNKDNLVNSRKALDNYILSNNIHLFIDSQYDLFAEGFKCSINWDSPKQVIPFLKYLGVNTTIRDRRTGKDKDTCEEKAIGKYKNKFPFLKLYFNYKAVAKEVSTYGIEFLEHINPVTGRVHSSFWQIVSTGRISSNHPNLQNIPAREDETGSQPFRECFRGSGNNTLIVADYSQQEPRVTADVCKDPALIEFYLNGDGDTHSMVSSRLFSVIEGKDIKITKGDPRRQIGKVLNLKLDYGGSAFTVKDDLKVKSEKEAQVFIDALEKAFPGKKDYFDRKLKETMKNGYILIDSITKRKLFTKDFDEFKVLQKRLDKSNNIPSLKANFPWSDYFKLKGKISRLSRNAPIQGTSGSMTKLAAIMLKKELQEKSLYNKVWVVNLVHDEIVIETSNEYIEIASKLLTKCMEDAGKVFCKTIPMVAEAVVSEYWAH